MARRKRTSTILEKAARRFAGMSAIDPHLTLDQDLSLPIFSELIETMRAQETTYNAALSNLDRLYQEMLTTERQLADLSEHMLLGVATRYGKSSLEYGMAGGVPKNQHRKGRRGESPTPQQLALPLNGNGSKTKKKAAASN